MAFEIFEDPQHQSQEFISVTVTKAFGLSRAFLDAHYITQSHRAVIIYDQDTNMVALYFSTTQPRASLAIRIPNPKHGGTIPARNFFDAKNIDPYKYAGRYYDFKKVDLRDLGIQQIGEAFLFTLRNKAQKHNTTYNNDYDIVDDKPIDLSEIPF